jgi:hypothetical protein
MYIGQHVDDGRTVSSGDPRLQKEGQCRANMETSWF